MTVDRPLHRRRFLRATTATVLATALAGCFGGDESPPSDGTDADGSPSSDGTDADGSPPADSNTPADSAETLGERPLPDTLVGSDAYVAAFEATVASSRFPDPDPDLIPKLTKARFVAEAARDAGDDSFADRVAAVRDPVFVPLERFDAVSVLTSKRRREQLDDEQRAELRERVGVETANVTLDDDPEVVFSTLLDDREMTFFDYPGTPLHVIEAAESRGLDRLAASPEDRAADVEEAHRPYVRQRARVEAVVAGARDVASEAYDEGVDKLLEQSPSERTYDSEEAYAAVVAFNAALAAESMLEADGEIVTPP